MTKQAHTSSQSPTPSSTITCPSASVPADVSDALTEHSALQSPCVRTGADTASSRCGACMVLLGPSNHQGRSVAACGSLVFRSTRCNRRRRNLAASAVEPRSVLCTVRLFSGVSPQDQRVGRRDDLHDYRLSGIQLARYWILSYFYPTVVGSARLSPPPLLLPSLPSPVG